MRDSYFTFVSAVGLLYYLLFMYKYDKKWRTLALTATMAGLIASIGSILENYFLAEKEMIRSIFIIPVVATIIAFFSIALPMT